MTGQPELQGLEAIDPGKAAFSETDVSLLT
jgi:hypothetical protein